MIINDSISSDSLLCEYPSMEQQVIKKCSSCLSELKETSSRCMGCSLNVYYCDKKCQKKDWPSHSRVCNAVKRPVASSFDTEEKWMAVYDPNRLILNQIYVRKREHLKEGHDLGDIFTDLCIRDPEGKHADLYVRFSVDEVMCPGLIKMWITKNKLGKRNKMKNADIFEEMVKLMTAHIQKVSYGHWFDIEWTRADLILREVQKTFVIPESLLLEDENYFGIMEPRINPITTA